MTKRTLISAVILIFTLCIPAYAKSAGQSGFAVSDDGSVYLLMPNAEFKIQKFNSSGVMQDKFAMEGPKEDQLLAPVDMTIYKDKIYVIDKFGPQIKVFTLSGKSWKAFGTDYMDGEKLKNPVMMRIRYNATLERDVIYVLDKGIKRIMKYELDGDFIEALWLPPEYENTFDFITSFNIDSKDHIWLTTDTLETSALRHVLVFDEAGFPVNDYSMTQMAGQFGIISDIITLEDGGFIIADSSPDPSSEYSGSIILFDAKEPKERFQIQDKQGYKFYSPKRMLRSGDSMYVLTTDNYLLKLSVSYTVMMKWNLN